MDVMIIEDSGLVRGSLKRALVALPEIRLVSEVADTAHVLEALSVVRPDVVLIDLGPFSSATLSLLGEIRAAGHGCWIVVLTDALYPRFCEFCKKLGADAVFDKSMEFDQVVAQLKSWMPPRPANEASRLLLLEQLSLLDTPEETSFDDLAALAADIAETPIALVSLVNGSRQWFKAHHGLESRETSRSVAFCAHAINGDDLFIVEDASRDPRFATNPLVRGDPHIRFYAGMPLLMPGGEALGTLCVIDRVPRVLTERQKHVLRVLARNVVTEFDLRLRVRTLEREVTRRQSAETLALQLATRDALTGLPNRTTLVDRLHQAALMASRDSHQVAFIFLDLDNFKWVNDTFGHQIGDGLLQAVGERLVAQLRESDTVARLGGDEFAIVLPVIEGTDAVEAVARKLQAALAQPIDICGHQVLPHCSIGIAIYPDHGADGEALMRYADLALYDAKDAGGNCWRFFEESMGIQAKERLLLEIDLHAAISNGQFEVWYQPQTDFGDSSLVAVEALLRWHHPRLGMVSPARFIPLAEECGFIWELGTYVLEQSLAQLVAWDQSGVHVPRVAVNVSARQLRPGFAALVERLLDKYAVAPERLELEITESTYALDGPHLLDATQRLSALGVGFAVDDFGVGYSSLAQLKSFPVTTLKIDRAFTGGLDDDLQNRAIVQSIITLCATLGLRSVAEGVEDARQSALLHELGCDVAQGYHHGRPLPPALLCKWLAERRMSTVP